MITIILKLENFVIFLSSLYAYQQLSGDWSQFALLFLTPDLSILGYLVNNKVGAITYNLIHTYVLVFILLTLGILGENDFLTSLGLILSAHIAVDRALGFGLKSFKGYKETHI